MDESMFTDEVKRNAQALFQARQEFAFQDSSNPITFETLKKYLKLTYDSQYSLDRVLFTLPRLVDGANSRYAKAVFACAYWIVEADVPDGLRKPFYSSLADFIPVSFERGLQKTIAPEAMSLLLGKGENYKQQITEVWEQEHQLFGGLLFEMINKLL